MLFIHETFIVYKLETFKKCKGKAHYEYYYCYHLHFLILCDISLIIENYFQKILMTPPSKIHSHIFTQSPLKIQEVQVPPFAKIENFSGPLQKKEDRKLEYIDVFFVK